MPTPDVRRPRRRSSTGPVGQVLLAAMFGVVLLLSVLPISAGAQDPLPPAESTTTTPPPAEAAEPPADPAEPPADPAEPPADPAEPASVPGVSTTTTTALTPNRPPLVTAALVPVPDANSSVITVKVGGDRSGTSGVTGLQGVTLQLFDTETAMTPTTFVSPNTCVSDADGDCSWIVNNTNPGGSNRDRRFWVRQIAPAAPGTFSNTQLNVGNNGSWPATNYQFQTCSQLRGGVTCSSQTTGPNGFMLATGSVNTASGGIWQTSRANPTPSASCGLSVALVLDLSGSVGTALPSLKTAAQTFVNSLVGTPSSVGLFTFASSGPAAGANNVNRPLTPVSTTAGATTVNNWITGLSIPTGPGNPQFTNWDRALNQVSETGELFDVGVVITDGNPTAYGIPPTIQTDGRTRFREVENGIFSANGLKALGTRVIAFGVGAGVGGSGLNLQSISGPTLNSDYFQTTDFQQAGDQLRELALGACANSVSVIKQVIPPGGTIADASPSPGWTFDATTSTPGVTISPSSAVTNDTGGVNFELTLPGGVSNAAVEITETLQPGFTLVQQGGANATCRRLDTDAPIPVTNVGALGFALGAAVNVPISCTVYNQAPNPPATVQVDKQWVVNGTTFDNGLQPPGLIASPVVNGQAEVFGTPIGGFTAGDSVEIDEVVDISDLPLCTLDSTEVTLANGSPPTDGALPYTAQLVAGANTYRITNTVTCTSELELTKSVVGGPEPPTAWDLEAIAPADAPPGTLPGPSGLTGVRAEVTPGVRYALAESGGNPNYVQDDFRFPGLEVPGSTGSWTCIEIDENGNQIPGFSDGINGGVVVPLGQRVRCTATNRTAALTLVKQVTNDDGGTATPDRWTLTATPGGTPPAGVVAQSVPGSTAGATIYVRPGQAYDLTESGPGPPAYVLDSLRCVVDEGAPQDVTSITLDPEQGATCTFVNDDQPVYQILVTPATATNRLTDDHEFQVEVRTDSDGDGSVDDPVVGGQVQLSWAGPAGSGIDLVNGVAPSGAPTDTATCTTVAPIPPYLGGVCLVQVSSPDNPGAGTLTASFGLPSPGTGAPALPTPDAGTTCTNPTITDGVITQCNAVQDVERIEASGAKTWVGYVVDVEPDATNPVDVAHTFTIDVDRSDGTTSAPAADVTVNFTWTGVGSVTQVNGSVVPPASGTSCVTDAAGQCTVVVLSPDFGSGTLAVTTVVGDLVPPAPPASPVLRTETPAPSSDLTATKTWVDWRVLLTPPSDTNAVGQAHVFTATLERNDGTGWVADANGGFIQFDWSGPAGSAITAVSAGVVANPTAASCNTDAAGQCTVTVSSPASGTGTLTATSVIVELAGYTPPGGSPLFPFDIDDVQATKTWVAIRGTVSPPAATNIVGDPHDFTILVETQADGGWVPAPAGTTVTFVWAGAGAVTAVDEPGPDATSCTLRADDPGTPADETGTCVVTVDSDAVGFGAIVVQDVTSLVVNGTQLVPTGGSLPVGDADPSPGEDSPDGAKTWVQFQAEVGDTATNLAGDDHTFTLDATFDGGTGPTALPDGSTITFTWTGDGQVTEVNGSADPDATTCVVTAGSCTVTVSSATPGSGDITIVSVTATVNGTPLTGVVTTTPPSLVPAAGGSLTATKTWASLAASVEATAVNLAGDDHTFTLSATYDDGTGPVAVPDGSTIAFTWAGGGSVTKTNGADDAGATLCTTTGATGTCTVTVSSATPGSGTIEIVSVTVTAATGDVLFDPSPVAIPGGALTADKTWVAITASVEATATNLVGDDHQFTLTATYDDGTGPQPANGASFAYTWSGAGTAAPPSPCVAAADANTCVVTVSSTAPGTGTITIDTVTDTVLGTTFTDVTAVATSGGSLTADKTWIAFDVDVTPGSAVNPVDVDHTFTISVRVDEGGGLQPLTIPPDSGEVDWSFEAPDGSTTTGTCTLVAGGTCEVVQGSADFGTGTLTATALSVNVGGADYGPIDLTAAASGQSDQLTIPVEATKTWVDWRVQVTPPAATNATDQPHVFTLTLERNDGTGWVAEDAGNKIATTWAGPMGSAITAVSAGVVDNPTAASCNTDAAGQCTVTVESSVNGAGTLTVTQVTVDLPGYAPPGLPAGDPFIFDVDDVTGDKTWVAIRGTVSPPAATNLVGDPHDFTILVETDDGAGWVPAPAGTTVTFTWAGAGAVTGVDEPGPDATSCTLRADDAGTPEDEAGTCVVTVDSDAAGTGTLTVTVVTSLVVNGEQLVPAGGSLPVGDADPSPGEDSRDGAKTWVQFQATVGDTATNLVNDDHVFTLTATYDNGTGPVAVPDGSTIAFTWTGKGSVILPNAGATSCTTTAGTCDVTVSAAEPGTGTIELVSVAATIGGIPLTGVTTTTPPSLVAAADGSLTADKTWIEFEGDAGDDATNLTGDDHDFILTASYDDGTGTTKPVPDGSTITFTFSGTGSVTAPSPGATTCTTTGGQCTVTVNSDLPGVGTIAITAVTASVNGTLFTDAAVVPAVGGDPAVLNANKTWVAFDVDITPDVAFNVANDPHTFTITARYDDGTGPVAVPDGSTITFSFSGVGSVTAVNGLDVPPASGTSCTTTAGQCTVTANSLDLGLGTLTASQVQATVNGIPFSVDLTAAGIGQSTDLSIPVDALKFWLGYEIALTPASDVNLWPEEPDHVVTLTLTRLPEVPELPIDGQSIDVVLDSTVATITAVGGGGTIDPSGLKATCITDAEGNCDVTISSAGPGAATLSASFTFTDGTDTFVFPAANEAEKTWRAFRVGVTPDSATNLLGDPHTFTVRVESTDDGSTWVPVVGAVPTTSVTAPAVVDADTCSAGTDAQGECTVTVSSPSTGSVTLTAQYEATIDEASTTVSGDAEKTWIDYRIGVAPREATNQVGDPHTFTVTLEVDRGSGFGPAAGERVQISTSGVGSVVGIAPAGPDAASCTTDAAGLCQVTVNSQQPGSLTVTASYLASAGSAERTLSAQGTKNWTTPPTTAPPTTTPRPPSTPPPTTTPPPRRMPPTGADLLGMTWLGAGIVGLGVLIALRARRRLRTTSG